MRILANVIITSTIDIILLPLLLFTNGVLECIYLFMCDVMTLFKVSATIKFTKEIRVYLKLI